MFNFNPIPEEQLNKSSWENIREGIVSFKIADISFDRGPMNITFQIKDNKGNTGRWFDDFYDHTQWKTLQLLKSVGRSSWYSTGKIDPEMLKGLEGQCEMKFKEYKGKTSLKISRYIEMEASQLANGEEANKWEDDDLPF